MENIIEVFLKKLNNFCPIPKTELEKLKRVSSIKTIKKGEYFLKQGEKSFKIGFVINGLFRTSYLTMDGKEFTKGFFPENSFLASYCALLENKESYFFIEALEDSKVVIFDYNDWILLCKNEISWNKLLNIILGKAFCVREDREREFLTQDAQNRYQHFIKTYPQLLNRLKQHMLASYLGITPEALSSIKKQLKS